MLVMNNTEIELEPPSLHELKIRLSGDEIDAQRQLFSDINVYTELLDSTPTCLLVLNAHRQIVYANKMVNDFVGAESAESPYGKRPGELLKCKHAFITPSGCGTSDYCDTCGSLGAIISSLNGEEDVQECRILQKDTNDAMDLRVWARPLTKNNQKFSIYNFVDISDEKRRLALERIFFHDVLNSAGGLSSYINLLNESTDEQIKGMVPIVIELTNNLVEEITTQRALIQAENSELTVNIKRCNSLKIIKNLVNQFGNRIKSEVKSVEIDVAAEVVHFSSDDLLITRVLRNMLKNAIESTKKGGMIKIGCKLSNNIVQFYINNPGHIPIRIQRQIFQRSFSTKGLGRGLGTYSMKLITERYLKGKIYFTSLAEAGTTFIAEYPIEL
jgi:signal transduction histidine kinase